MLGASAALENALEHGVVLLPCARMRNELVNRPVCVFFASYSDSGHLGSYLSTQSNENTNATAFLCCILHVHDNRLFMTRKWYGLGMQSYN